MNIIWMLPGHALFKVGKAMAKRLRIDTEQIGNIFHSAIPQFADLDRSIPPPG